MLLLSQDDRRLVTSWIEMLKNEQKSVATGVTCTMALLLSFDIMNGFGMLIRGCCHPGELDTWLDSCEQLLFPQAA